MTVDRGWSDREHDDALERTLAVLSDKHGQVDRRLIQRAS